MKVGFFGTPHFAAYCFSSLTESHEIVFVATGEDKPAGRKQVLQSPPVKNLALQKNIPVLQPGDPAGPSFIEEIEGMGADIFVVVAYGKILPRRVFDLPRYRTINLHPSLLPRYRGAAPMEWALINGEEKTGISVQLMNERMDAGDIVLQSDIPLGIDMTAGELYNIVLPLGADLLLKALDLISSGSAGPVPQDESMATYCGKISRDTGHIDWKRPALEIHNLVRGLSPRPAAWSTFRDKNIKILRTSLIDDDPGINTEPGGIYKYQKKRLIAGTGDGLVEIVELQPETKKAMDAPAFLNGHRIEEGDSFSF